MKSLLLFAILLLSFGCKPEEKEKIYTAPPITELELVWKAPFATREGGEGRTPIVSGNKVLFTGKSQYENSSSFCFDATTGDTLWVKKDYIGRIPYVSHQFVENGKYVLNRGGKTWVFDIESGDVVWSSYHEYAEWNFTILDNTIYQTWRSEEWPPTFHRLMETPIESNQWSEVFTLYQDSLDGFHPDIVGPSIWRNPQGDELLVFLNRAFTQGEASLDFYSYNPVTQKIELRIKGLDTNQVSPLPPLIDQNRAYVKGRYNVYCIDLLTGDLKWKSMFNGYDGYQEGSNLVIDENKLIVHQGEALYAFDKYSGNLAWRNPKIGAAPSTLKLHKSVVYYSTRNNNRLHGVRTNNGEVVLRMASPHENTYAHYINAGFEQGVDISSELNYLYAQDDNFLMCFKLPDYK